MSTEIRRGLEGIRSGLDSISRNHRNGQAGIAAAINNLARAVAIHALDVETVKYQEARKLVEELSPVPDVTIRG